MNANGAGPSMAGDTVRTVTGITLTDSDYDKSLRVREEGGAIRAELLGYAGNNENDLLRLNFATLPDVSAVELDVTMPSRLDQSNSLRVQVGTSNAYNTYIDTSNWMVRSGNTYQSAWSLFQANQTYKISIVINRGTSDVWFYVNENLALQTNLGSTSLNSLGLGNNGYAAQDLVYVIDNIRLLDAFPAYHGTPRAPDPVQLVAIGAATGTALTWTNNASNTTVRVVRKTGSYPSHENDGAMVYEGTATQG